MINIVLGCHVGATFPSKEIAELCASGYDLAELEINRVWHEDCLLLYDFRQAQQVPNGDCMETSKPARAMAHQPSNDSPCVLFVLNVEVEERGRNSSSTWGR